LAALFSWLDQSVVMQCLATCAYCATIQPSFVSLGLIAHPDVTDCVPLVRLVGVAEQVQPHTPALQFGH
jgi:hypothetical protein